MGSQERVKQVVDRHDLINVSFEKKNGKKTLRKMLENRAEQYVNTINKKQVSLCRL